MPIELFQLVPSNNTLYRLQIMLFFIVYMRDMFLTIMDVFRNTKCELQ